MQEPAALVDIGGLDGSVPTAELYQAARSAGRDENSIKIGQKIDVEVGKARGSAPRPRSPPPQLPRQSADRSFAQRSLADPMAEALSTLSEGERVRGRVVRLEPFGAFVEICTGVEALIHISLMAERHITHPRKSFSLGKS